jgi:hypothetical protein
MERFLCYVSAAGCSLIVVSYPLLPERLLPVPEWAHYAFFKAE